MSIREINDQYKEYADAHEPVKGKKSHGGIALAKQRMVQAASAAVLSVTAMTVLTTMVLNIVFTLSAQVLPQTATFHEVEFSYAVETSDFAEAGVYYTLTDPDGTVLASAPLAQAKGTMFFSDLEENTRYTFSVFDKNGKRLDFAALTTADNPAPVPQILSLTASYNRLTETVTIHGQVEVNDAPNFTAALSSSDFELDAAAVEVTLSENGTADVSYSGLHPLTMDTYSVELTVGYTDEEDAQKQLTKTTSFHVSDLVINGFSGTVSDKKIINLDAIATHHHTDSEPYTVRSVTITGKQIYTGKTFDVPATFTVNGDSIMVDAKTDKLASGKYRFDLEIEYTINNTDSPIFTATTDAIEVTVPADPVVSPKPTVTPAPTTSPSGQPSVSPTTSPTSEPSTSPTTSPTGVAPAVLSSVFDITESEDQGYNLSFVVDVAVNDGENIYAQLEIYPLGIDTSMVAIDNGDDTITFTSPDGLTATQPGKYYATAYIYYTIDGTEANTTAYGEDQIGTIEIVEASAFSEYADTDVILASDIYCQYTGPSEAYSITQAFAYFYDANQSYLGMVPVSQAQLGPSLFAQYNTDVIDSAYYAEWTVSYTIGEGDYAFSGTVESGLLPIEGISANPPSVSSQVRQGIVEFLIEPGDASEITITGITVNGQDAAGAGYRVANNVDPVNGGNVTVSGNFDGECVVSISYSYTLRTSADTLSDSASATIDGNWYNGFTFSDLSLTDNGDGTATVSGSFASDSSLNSVTLTHATYEVVTAAGDAVGAGNLNPEYNSSTKSGTFTVTVPAPADGSAYNVFLAVSGSGNGITIQGNSTLGYP